MGCIASHKDPDHSKKLSIFRNGSVNLSQEAAIALSSANVPLLHYQQPEAIDLENLEAKRCTKQVIPAIPAITVDMDTHSLSNRGQVNGQRAFISPGSDVPNGGISVASLVTGESGVYIYREACRSETPLWPYMRTLSLHQDSDLLRRSEVPLWPRRSFSEPHQSTGDSVTPPRHRSSSGEKIDDPKVKAATSNKKDADGKKSFAQRLLKQFSSQSRDHSCDPVIEEEVNIMDGMAKVVLLACGSFNPITNMHLRMFELARDTMNRTGRFKVVAGIVSPVNDGYGKQDLVSSKHRCAMARLALKSSDWIKLDAWEAESETWVPTATALKHYKNSLDSIINANPLLDTPTKKRKLDANMSPADEVHVISNYNINDGPIQLKLLCGADLLESFAVPGLWKEQDIEDIVSNYGMVCITRAGSNPERFIYESDVLSRHRDNIHIVTEWITNDISATKIRRALRRDESVKYLVQDPVIDYIKSHDLYSVCSTTNNNVSSSCSSSHEDPDRDKESPPAQPNNSHNVLLTYLSPQSVYFKQQNRPMLLHQPRSYQDHRDDMYAGHNISRESSTKEGHYSSFDGNDGRHRSYRRRRDQNYDEEYKVKKRDQEKDEEDITNDISRSRSHVNLEDHKKESIDSPDSQNTGSSSKRESHHDDSVDSTESHPRWFYRKQDSVDSSDSRRRHSYRRKDSADSMDSDRSRSRSPNPVTCMGADITGLMRRVRGMRVTVTPETCV